MHPRAIWGARPEPAPRAEEIECNTFSIVAYDPNTNEWGCAVSSKYLGVGNVVPHGKAGAGMVATQANVNIAHGPNGVELLAKGLSAEEVAAFNQFNNAYREKFGFPFVICARLNKREAILNAFPVRLGHSPEQEIQAALGEIYKIAYLRLEDIIASHGEAQHPRS